MATAKATVYIGGTGYSPYHIMVDQRTDWHSRFEITVSTEMADVMGGARKASESVIIDNAIALVGEKAEISIERPSGTLEFSGYVTNVQFDQSYAGDSFIIFSGYSPTYLLNAQASVKTYEEKKLNEIFTDVLQGFPENVSKKIDPAYDQSISYVTRYKETQFQFLSRLANLYGEWFYYDGSQIIFGKLPDDGPAAKLKFGSDSMLSLNYGINLEASGYQQQFYKYEDNSILKNSLKDYKPGWLGPHGKKAQQAAKSLFAEEGVQPVSQRVRDDQHLKYLGEAKKASITGRAMQFNGQSADPAVCAGGIVEVESRHGFIGKYRVISVVHHFDGNRDYNNVFRAIPHTTEVPPPRPEVSLPVAETQAAVVTDNNDPEGQGRVRVRFKWQEGQTPWIRMINNHAGEDRGEGVYGTYFTPENGDEVMVAFAQDHPDRPYVLGSVYHSGIPSEFADSENNLKSIKTRTGHILLFDDTAGQEQIHLTDKNGNFLTIDTAGDTITINAGEHITIKAGSSIAMEAGQTISLKSGDSISLTSGNIGLVAGSAVSVNAGASYNLNTNTKMENVASSAMLRTKSLTNYISEDYNSTAKTINQTAKKSINSKAKKNILISADSKLEQRGGKVDVNAKKGKMRLKAKGNTEIKGRQIKAN